MDLNRRSFALSLLAATSAAAITGTAVAQPMPAGTMPTMQFLAMASKGGMFLEETARTGFEKTGNPSLRRFARAEVNEQVTVSDKLAANSGMMAGTPGMAPSGGLVGGLVAAPFAVAGAAVGVAGAAVGVAGAAVGLRPGEMTTDAQKADMIARLRSMPAGPQFDAMFVDAQLIGHNEAFVIYDSYARSGDDPALRRVARNAIPLIKLHISQLSRMAASMGAPVG